MKVNFKELKSKVGIDDVAYKLGYLIDKKAGIGRYIEMINPISSDKIVIKNPQDKANQTYFRRDARKGGDVISFIQENLTALGQVGKNQWEAVVSVLADFSNTYVQESKMYLDSVGYKGSQSFDKNRYDVQPILTGLVNVSRLFQSRGLNMDTISAFSEKIFRIKDLHNTAYDNYNIAFPYTRPQETEIVGYEVRGYKGFKSKAAGTDSSKAAWIVDLSTDKNPLSKKYVFFAESAFDAMAFYQANKNKIDLSTSVFVSIGGTFSDNQVISIMQYYRNAKAVDCFDNDIPGKIYGIRLLCLLNEKKLETSRENDLITLRIGKIVRTFKEKELTPYNISREFHLQNKVELWKPYEKYKDWNDFILQKTIVAQQTKYELHSQLAQRRKIKM